jgi:hypothetical protein
MAALLFIGSASAAPAVTVRVTSAEGASGSVVSVRLEVLDVPEPGLGAFTIDIEYDAAVASPASCHENPDGVLDAAICNTAFSGNTVRVGGFRASSGASGSVPLASIDFRLVGQEDDCGSLVPKVIELTDTQALPITDLSLVSGSLCVRGEGAPAATPASQTEEPRPTTDADSTPRPGSSTGVPGASTVPPGASTVSPAEATAAAEAGAVEEEGAGASDADQTQSPEGGTPNAEGSKDSKAGQTAKTAVQATGEGSDEDNKTPWIAALVVGGIGLPLGAYSLWRLTRRRRRA